MAPRRVSLLPPLAVIVLVSCMYTVYLLLHLVPQLRRLRFLQSPDVTARPLPPRLPSDPHMHPASLSEVLGLALAFHATFAAFIAAFFLAAVTPPGAVPRGDARWERGHFGIDHAEDAQVEDIIRNVDTDLNKPEVRALVKRMPIVERKKAKAAGDEEAASLLSPSSAESLDELKRKCHGCMIYKPDRVHHCQVCGQCVLRMDHHCPWIANCVGFRNYKYFLLVLVYAVLSMALLIVSLLPRFLNVFAPILDMEYFLTHDLPVAITFGCAALLCLVLASFLSFHLWLVGHAMSTIEYREKKNHGDAEVKHRWAVSHIKYDQGSVYANFKHVLGEPYQWLFPVDPRPSDDGTYTQVYADQQQSGKAL